MEEQLISFETAKLAKEKGFNIVTKLNPSYYRQFNINRVPVNDIGYTRVQDFVNNGDYIFLAPTQSLLQKWLREVHNIHLAINFANKNQWFYDIKRIGLTSGKEYIFKSNYEFNTYEEALEKGLYQALSLI